VFIFDATDVSYVGVCNFILQRSQILLSSEAIAEGCDPAFTSRPAAASLDCSPDNGSDLNTVQELIFSAYSFELTVQETVLCHEYFGND
jgi:hypothetical protein